MRTTSASWMSSITLLAAGTTLLAGPSAAQSQELDAAVFRELGARSIGPAGMSGRVSSVAVSRTDPEIIFVGTAAGGLWKSDDAGISWRPVFDGNRLLSIGAVQVSPTNADVVWVGGGEGNPRNSAGVGNGVYRSLDGGDTWAHLGLENSERIHRILLHPSDPDVAWVGAMGPAWSDGDERGVFKTSDGGRSWERVLEAGPRAGVGDLVMDPRNPDKLFAALWEYRRSPWFFESGGPASGLYVSHDGGDSWTQLTSEDGLPSGELGRIGVAIAGSRPEVVYALVEAARSALIRSDDGGKSWRTVSDRPGVAPRPFYYADLRVDPENENRLYSLHSAIQVSEDAGRSFRTVVPSRTIHGDVHELWIDPSDPSHLILGEDGGIAVSYDRGEHWRFVENLPLAQFYHIAVDDEVPFNIYGGLQDNGSWFGPSDVWEDRGIMNGHWRRVGGGDGFSVLPDRVDSRYGYSMSQGGSLQRFDKVTGARWSIRPVHPDGVRLRFNWNAGLTADPIDSTTLYLGSQFLHRSRDRGESWELISPDLTSNDPTKQRQQFSGGLTLDATGAENHTTIVAIAPSPLESGTLWVGTDDGRIQITRDGGESWEDVAPRITGVPAGTWVPHIEASRHATGRAYAVFDDHRRGNWETYVFVTEDFGQSWRTLATPALFGFAHVLEEDPVEPGLLFLGTEAGLYVSVDRGASWAHWTEGVPPAPVRDLVVHPRDHDLVVGTHGRALYVVDDIRPLRSIAAAGGVPTTVTAFPAPRARQHDVAEAIGYRSVGHAMFFGESRAYGALLSFWVPDATSGAARVEIRDATGASIRTLSSAGEAGLRRVVWNLRPEGPAGGLVREPEVLPGTYQWVVSVDGVEAVGEVQVVGDPRVPVSLAEAQARVDAIHQVGEWVALGAEIDRRVDRALSEVDATEGGTEGELAEQRTALLETLRAFRERVFSGPECQGICGGDPEANRVRAPLGPLGAGRGTPTPNERLLISQANAAIRSIVEQANALFSGPVTQYRDGLAQAGFSPISVDPPLEVGISGGR